MQVRDLWPAMDIFNVFALFGQQWEGDVTVVMPFSYRQLSKVVSNPSKDVILCTARQGEREMWPKLAMIETNCGIEVQLDECTRELRLAMQQRAHAAVAISRRGRVVRTHNAPTRTRTQPTQVLPHRLPLHAFLPNRSWRPFLSPIGISLAACLSPFSFPQPSWNTIGFQSGRDLAMAAPLGSGRGSIGAHLSYHGGGLGSAGGSRAANGDSDDRCGQV